VADRRDDLADDRDVAVGERVQRLGHRPLDAVLDGDDAAVVLAASDAFDDAGHRLGELDVVGHGSGRTVGVRPLGTEREYLHTTR
jgi:hypothetical protein